MATEHVLDGTLAHMGTTAGLIIARASHLRPTHPGAGATGAVMLLAAVAVHLTTALLVFTDSFDPRLIGEVVTTTAWGRSFVVLTAGSALAAWGGLRRRRRPTEAGAALAIVGLVWMGHGSSEGSFTIRVAVHAVHVAAIVAWASGLLALAVEIGTGGRPIAALRVFSGRAVPLVAVVLLTGALLTGRYVPGLDALLTPYGLALAAKVALVAGIGAAALANRRSTARGPDWPRLDSGLFAEVSLFVLTLGATALLTQLEPP